MDPLVIYENEFEMSLFKNLKANPWVPIQMLLQCLRISFGYSKNGLWEFYVFLKRILSMSSISNWKYKKINKQINK